MNANRLFNCHVPSPSPSRNLAQLLAYAKKKMLKKYRLNYRTNASIARPSSATSSSLVLLAVQHSRCMDKLVRDLYKKPPTASTKYLQKKHRGIGSGTLPMQSGQLPLVQSTQHSRSEVVMVPRGLMKILHFAWPVISVRLPVYETNRAQIAPQSHADDFGSVLAAFTGRLRQATHEKMATGALSARCRRTRR
jgi:hypothetical protein